MSKRAHTPGRLALIAAAALTVAGCRSAEGSRPDAGPASDPIPVTPGFTLDLTPRPDAAALLVEIRVAGPPARAVRELRVTRAWAGTRGADAIDPASIELYDDRGDVPTAAPRDDGEDRVIALLRPPTGELALQYTAMSGGARLGLRVVRERMTGVGHGFLLLPRMDAPVPVRIRWHLDALGAAARGASSFGEGDVSSVATSAALAHAVYAAGALASAGDGAERVVSLETRALELREVLPWAARVRGLAATLLDGESDTGKDAGTAAPSTPFLIFLLGEPSIGKDHDGAYLDRALGLWIDSTRHFDAQLRIALAHELLHRHLGGTLRLLDAEGRPEAWFAEGLTVHYARRLLFDAGLLSVDEFIEDLQRIQRDEPTPDAAPAERDAYRRGSRYAARLDHALRRSGKGARSLEDLLRALRTRGPGPYRNDDFRAMVKDALGEPAAIDFDRMIVNREIDPDLDPGTFGPCFRSIKEKQTVFDLGFDRDGLRATPSLIRGLVKGSTAEKAGLREGALVLLAKRVPRPEDGPDAQVDLTIADRRGGKRVRYKPRAVREIDRWEAKPCRRPGPGG